MARKLNLSRTDEPRARFQLGPHADVLRVLTCEEMRAYDARAVAELGLPSIVLMENASRNAAVVAIELLETADIPAANEAHQSQVLIFCGTGNNGGDGLGIARHLTIQGVLPCVFCVGLLAELKGDARIMAQACAALGLDIIEANAQDAFDHLAHKSPPTLIIDAIFGTGLSRPPQAAAHAAINAINTLARRGSLVLAIDVPSGLNADTGVAMGVAVHADVTVTFAALKPGLLQLQAQEFVGELAVVDIGVPINFAEDLGTRLPVELFDASRSLPDVTEAHGRIQVSHSHSPNDTTSSSEASDDRSDRDLGTGDFAARHEVEIPRSRTRHV